MEHARLLPDGATPRELAIAEVADPLARFAAVYDLIREVDRHPPPTWMPFLIGELGLGELTPYVPNLYDLVAEGIAWQRVRGTSAAVSRGLGWLGYAASFEQGARHRRRWHLWQMHLDRVRDAERPDLVAIDGIASLSDDAVSEFWRGFAGYDVRACEAGGSRWGGAIWGDHSGVRLDADGAKWSFGRRHEAIHELTQAEAVALDCWIEPVPTGGAWVDAHAPWTDAHYPWDVPAAQSRRNVMASSLAARSWYFVLRAGDGALIGCVRAFAHAVREAVDGEYAIGAGRFTPSSAPTGVLIQARTPFCAAAGATVATVELIPDVPRADGVGPGRAWLGPDDIDAVAGVWVPVAVLRLNGVPLTLDGQFITLDAAVATLAPTDFAAVGIPLGATVREHLLCLLRF